jgi:hypothetical protein
MGILKKSFKLNPNNCNEWELDALQALDARIQVASTMIQTSKAELEDAIVKRNKVLGDILSKFDYIVSKKDKVIFNGQLSEITIYGNGNGITEEEEYG